MGSWWGTAREADHLEDSYGRKGRKGTSGQHGYNQSHDAWAGTRCASEVRRRPMWQVSLVTIIARLLAFAFLAGLLGLRKPSSLVQPGCFLCVVQKVAELGFQFLELVCLKAFGTNSIFCGGCSSWIHKKYSVIPGTLKTDPCFRCKRYTGQARPINGRPMTRGHSRSREAWGGAIPLLSRGLLSSGGSCELASITRCHVAWGKFNESCPSSPPAHLPSPQEEQFTIRVPTAPCMNSCKRNFRGT